MPRSVSFEKGGPLISGGVATTADTAVAADAFVHDTYLRTSASDAVTLTVNDDTARGIGWVLTVEQAGTGAVTFAAESGVTINCAAAQSTQTNGQYAVAQIRKVESGEYTLYGNLAAAS